MKSSVLKWQDKHGFDDIHGLERLELGKAADDGVNALGLAWILGRLLLQVGSQQRKLILELLGNMVGLIRGSLAELECLLEKSVPVVWVLELVRHL